MLSAPPVTTQPFIAMAALRDALARGLTPDETIDMLRETPARNIPAGVVRQWLRKLSTG